MQLHKYIASQIVRGTQRKFSRMHSDYLEQRMSETTNNMTVGSQVNVGRIKQVDHRAIEGSNAPSNFVEGESQDFSTEAFKSQPGPRSESGTKGA